MKSKQQNTQSNAHELLQPSIQLQTFMTSIHRHLQTHNLSLSEINLIFTDKKSQEQVKQVKAFANLSYAKRYYQAKVFDIDPSFLTDTTFNDKSYSWQTVFSQQLIGHYFQSLQYPNIPYRLVTQTTIDHMTLILHYDYPMEVLLSLNQQNYLMEASKIASDYVLTNYANKLKQLEKFAYAYTSSLKDSFNMHQSLAPCKSDQLIAFYNALHQEHQLLPLSQKQKQIAKLAYEGCTTKEIAYKLNIASSTAIDYLNTVKAKLGTDSKSALIQLLHHCPFLFAA